MKCPIKLDKIHCENCYWSKENLCDWPYQQDMTPEEIKETSEKGLDKPFNVC